MSAVTLYQLSEQYRALEALADEDVPEEAIRDTLEGLTGELELKATNVVRFSEHLSALRDAIEAASKAMKERAARIDRRVAALHNYVLVNMRVCGITKIESPEFTISIQKNPPAVVIDAEGELPSRFMTMPPPSPPPQPRPDKRAIADALKAGETVPGAHLEQGERLRVKA